MSTKKLFLHFSTLVLAVVMLLSHMCQPANAWSYQKGGFYQAGLSNASQGKYFEAIRCMGKGMYGTEDVAQCTYGKPKMVREFGIFQNSYISAGENNSAIVHEDGTVTVVGSNEYSEKAANQWKDITAVSVGKRHIVGLKSDGTVVAAGSSQSGRCNVASWHNIVAIAAGAHHTVGLTSGGDLVAVGSNSQGQCQVEQLREAAGWFEIEAIAAGKSHTLALTWEGSVVACGDDSKEACQVQDWTNIVAIYAGDDYSAGLRGDGTVVTSGEITKQWDLSGWTDLVQLAAGDSFLVGLTSDGRVLTAGAQGDYFRKCLEPVNQWQNVGVVAAGTNQIIALTKDGTLLCAGYNNFHQCDFKDTQGREPIGVEEVYITEYIEDGTEYGVIQKFGSDGQLRWDYITQDPDFGSQFGPIWEIMQVENHFYFTENVYDAHPLTLVCLDTDTGEVLWKNYDFGVYSDVHMADEDGTLYLCGFGYGECDFAAISKDGKTLCLINEFAPYEAKAKWIRKVGTFVYVALDAYQEDGEVFLYRVSVQDNTYQYEGIRQEKDLTFY